MSDALVSNSVTPAFSHHTEKTYLSELKQSLKRADQQAKFLHLQAQVESLWQQVQRYHHDNN